MPEENFQWKRKREKEQTEKILKIDANKSNNLEIYMLYFATPV